MNFNTAISQLMIFINAAYKENVVPAKYAEGFLQLLNPVAPHITEELWNIVCGHNESIAYSTWPTFDESKLVDDNVLIPVQVNGKLKDTITVPIDSEESYVKDVAFENAKVKNAVEGKTIVKEIYIKNKIFNIVVK